MANERLSLSYLKRAQIRLLLLDQLLKEEDLPDVIREAQEIVELCQKAILLKKGVIPPKWHDVSDIIEGYLRLMPNDTRRILKELTKGAKWLRSQREVAFYGSIDLIPEGLYLIEDARRAIEIAKRYTEVAKKIIKEI